MGMVVELLMQERVGKGYSDHEDQTLFMHICYLVSKRILNSCRALFRGF